MLETPSIPRYSSVLIGRYSDNVTGADNQQERLDGYISGYVDGEKDPSLSWLTGTNRVGADIS